MFFLMRLNHIIFSFLTVMALSACSQSTPVKDAEFNVIQSYTQAYNDNDLAGMSALMHADIQWLQVSGDQIEVIANGKSELVTQIEPYLHSGTQSAIASGFVDGNYRAVREVVNWTGKDGMAKSQSALAIYEIDEELIRRVWYYPETQPEKNSTKPAKPLSITPDTLNEEWAVEWWLPRHEQKLRDKSDLPIDLVFIGDSITHGWEGEGQMIWQALYDERNGFNLGFGGDRTENVLWRLQNGALDGLTPKLIVLMIGTNNTGHRMDTPEDTVAGIQAILDDLEMRLPNTNFLLLSIFPRGKTADDPERRRNDEINALLKTMPKSRLVHHRDIGQVFMGEDGVIDEAIMPDLLHLSEDGYRLWAEAIEEDVARLMGE